MTPDVFDKEKADLEAEVLKLRRRLQIRGALLVLFIALVRVFGLKLTDKRLPEGRHKDRLIRAIERAHKILRARCIEGS